MPGDVGRAKKTRGSKKRVQGQHWFDHTVTRQHRWRDSWCERGPDFLIEHEMSEKRNFPFLWVREEDDDESNQNLMLFFAKCNFHSQNNAQLCSHGHVALSVMASGHK